MNERLFVAVRCQLDVRRGMLDGNDLVLQSIQPQQHEIFIMRTATTILSAFALGAGLVATRRQQANNPCGIQP